MRQHEYRPGSKVVVAAVLAVAATYVYFLIFAQFGLLRAVLVTAPGAVKSIMGVMGLAGVAGSGLAAWIYKTERSRRRLAAGFIVCALAAGLSLVAGTPGRFHVVALLVGMGTGFTTVTLAGVLRRAVGGDRLGAVIGWGTGLAYGFCSLPTVFAAGAKVQAGLALLAAGVGATVAGGLKLDASVPEPTGGDYAKGGIICWLIVLLALVGLDSGAFYLIQQTPAPGGGAWTEAGRLGINAGLHVAVAVLTGLALDRRWLGRMALTGTLALLTGCWLIMARADWNGVGALLYVAGVSVYSTLLVFYPAFSARPGLAALVYAVAGWGGSALGIAVAENQTGVPGWLLVVTGTVIAGALLARHAVCRPPGSEQK